MIDLSVIPVADGRKLAGPEGPGKLEAATLEDWKQCVDIIVYRLARGLNRVPSGWSVERAIVFGAARMLRYGAPNWPPMGRPEGWSESDRLAWESEAARGVKELEGHE